MARPPRGSSCSRCPASAFTNDEVQIGREETAVNAWALALQHRFVLLIGRCGRTAQARRFVAPAAQEQCQAADHVQLLRRLHRQRELVEAGASTPTKEVEHLL